MIRNKLAVLIALFASAPALALQALDETQLGDVSGEGLGAAYDNVVIYSPDYGQPGAFSLKLNLTESGPEAVIISEYRFHRSRNEIPRLPGETDADYQWRVEHTGGAYGTFVDPYISNKLGDLTNYKGDVFTALITGWPAGDVKQVERSFFRYNLPAGSWNGKAYTTTNLTGGSIGGINPNENQGTNYVWGMPASFFTNTTTVNIGNLIAKGQEFNNTIAAFDSRMDLAANKFDLHFRVDAITAQNAQKTGLNDHFLGYADAIGARFYGTKNMIWADPKRGMSMAMTMGLNMDELRITADPAGAVSSQLSAKGLDAYIPQGSIDQPMNISTVQFKQIQRGKWKTQTLDTEFRTQMRLEIAALPNNPAAVQRMQKGHIFVQSLNFGAAYDPSKPDNVDPEIVTGVEDIYLRDASGTIKATVNDVKHRAFVPRTVIYNEQIDLYNAANPNNKLPNIPNQNVIEIRGLEIQRMVMTTQDLNR